MLLKVNIENISISHASDIYEIMKQMFKRERRLNKDKEHFWVIALNNANNILNIELVSIGSTSNTIVTPMEVLSIPLQKRAVGIILVHNHPSNRPEPSEEDKKVTDRLIQACKLMNTPVLDHIIITKNSYYSFKSSGLLDRLQASNNYVLPYDLETQYHKETQEKLEQIVRQMLQDGQPIENIMKWTLLNAQEIESIKKESIKKETDTDVKTN